MKFWITKNSMERFMQCQNEGRTRQVMISTFRQYDSDRELELEILEHEMLIKKLMRSD